MVVGSLQPTLEKKKRSSSQLVVILLEWSLSGLAKNNFIVLKRERAWSQAGSTRERGRH